MGGVGQPEGGEVEVVVRPRPPAPVAGLERQDEQRKAGHGGLRLAPPAGQQRAQNKERGDGGEHLENDDVAVDPEELHPDDETHQREDDEKPGHGQPPGGIVRHPRRGIALPSAPGPLEQQGGQQDVEQRKPQVAEADLADAYGIVVEPEREQDPHREVLGDVTLVAVGAGRSPRRLEELVEIGEERVAVALPHFEHPEAAGEGGPRQDAQPENEGQPEAPPERQGQAEERGADPDRVDGKGEFQAERGPHQQPGPGHDRPTPADRVRQPLPVSQDEPHGCEHRQAHDRVPIARSGLGDDGLRQHAGRGCRKAEGGGAQRGRERDHLAGDPVEQRQVEARYQAQQETNNDRGEGRHRPVERDVHEGVVVGGDVRDCDVVADAAVQKRVRVIEVVISQVPGGVLPEPERVCAKRRRCEADERTHDPGAIGGCSFRGHGAV